MRSRWAPVNAPFTCPNNSLSKRLGESAAECTQTERAAPARAVFVQNAGDKFLARSAFPTDQHRRLAAGHFADGFEHPVDGRAFSLQLAAVEVAGLCRLFGRRGIADLRDFGLQDGNLPRLRLDPFDLADQLVVETLHIAVTFNRVEGHVRDLTQRAQEREVFAAEGGRVLFGSKNDQAHHLVADLQPMHQIDTQLSQGILRRRRFPACAQEGPLQVSQIFDRFNQRMFRAELARQVFCAIGRHETERGLCRRARR